MTWFLAENELNQHKYYFFNVPAPAYDAELTESMNNKVAQVVALFNSQLSRKLSSSSNKVIDVYTFTDNKRGFSNGQYQCDKRHLDYRILSSIETQLKLP